MYEEPYRWIEAVSNRRQYLDDQFRLGSPVLAISYPDGILLLTFSRGTPKLYEIYDRIGLGGIGHPADLGKLRFQLLDMAHLEGFQRSPSDVTGSRLVKYGLAPTMKQTFEEIFKAPFISKILLAELGQKSEQDRFVTIEYDGAFEEFHTGVAMIAATPGVQDHMASYVKQCHSQPCSTLHAALEIAIRTWCVGALRQEREQEVQDNEESDGTPQTSSNGEFPKEDQITQHLNHIKTDKFLECAVLDRTIPGCSKYRSLTREEALSSLSPHLQQVL